MSPNDADGMANSVDPDQTARSGSALFAQTYLSENLGSLRYGYPIIERRWCVRVFCLWHIYAL